MSTYYIRADGTAANKEAATSDSAPETSMNVTVHNAETFAAGDTIIVSDAGGVYRGTRLTVPSGGSVGNPITYPGSGSPVLKGSLDLTDGTYDWLASASGTNEYYCALGAEKNLWTNADVETSVDDWNAQASCAISWGTDQFWEGSHSLKVTPNDQWWAVRSDAKTIVQASTAYTVSFYVRPTDTLANDYVYVYDQDNNEIAAVSAGHPTGGAWTRVHLHFTTGVGDTGVKIHFEAQTNTVTWLDGFQVEAGSSETTWVNYGELVPSNPSLVDPGVGLVFLDDVSLTGGTLGALADHEWGYGDNDSLGFDTIYVRDNSGDPDTSGAVIEASQHACFYVYDKDYIVVDGLEFRHGWGGDYQGGFTAYLSTGSVVQNCEAHWNNANGIAFASGCTSCTIDSCTASYNGSHNIQFSGAAEDNRATGHTVSRCTSHHSRVLTWNEGNEFDGYGIKLQWCDNSVVRNNYSYSNDLQGIDLDVGTDGNDIYENKFYDNNWDGILLEIGAASNTVHHNLIYDNVRDDDAYAAEIMIWNDSQNNEIYSNVIYKTRTSNTSDFLILIGDSGATASSGTLIYGNVLDGGGFANNAIRVDGGATIATAQGLKIKNNILLNTDQVPIWIQSSSFTGFECDYNCYDVSGGNIIQRGSGTYPSYTLATHFATFGQDEHSLDTDPLLEDPANGKFWLQKISPCLGAGVDLGDDYRAGLHKASSWPDGVRTVNQSRLWDLGAYVSAQGELARHSRWLHMLSRHHGWR